MKTALAFSGGKDSWACLWLNVERLHEITVLWVNTGKSYPEILATAAIAKAMCPNFVEIVVDRDGQNAFHGLPADIVPVNWTRDGHAVHGAKDVMVQPYLNCCLENIALPILQYCKANGITNLIKGQRDDEGHKSASFDGCTVDGIVIEQPIQGWTAAQVLDYVGQNMPLPDHFRFKHTSMDCYDCTAFSSESKDRISHTETHHPVLFSAYEKRKSALRNALNEALKDEYAK